ncbi:MAG: FAD binding domain-containing protein [Rhodoferax sp.]|nr:FAD binding domain-containing protein [Rhodoferax sp.]
MIENQTDYQAPDTLAAALQLIDQQGYQLLNLGGSTLRSTDIRRQSHKLVSLRKVSGLDAIEDQAGALQIGASATYDQLLQNVPVQQCTALAQALGTTPEPHLRHTNTLGGAVHDGGQMHAPVLAALIALDATAEFVSRAGASSHTVESLGADGNRIAPASGTLLSKVTVVADRLPSSMYLPLDPASGRRPYQGIAVALRMGANGVQEVRLVLAGFSAFPLRLHSVENGLKNGPLDVDRIASAAALLDPFALQTPEQTQDYALHLARVLVRRVLAAVYASSN